MTGTVATKNEKIHVHGVALEILRIIPSTADEMKAPLVFVHEGLGSVALWRDFPAQVCAATGRSGFVYSRRGYGQSGALADVRGAGRLPPDYMHREAWETLPELLRLLGVTKPMVIGHSDGGTIALLYAARFEAAACIVMASHLFVEDMTVAAIEQARLAYEHGNLRERLQRYHADVDSAFWQWNDVWLSSAFRGFNIEADCQTIACPLLAMQGVDDSYGSMAQIEALALPSDAEGFEKRVFLNEISLQPAKNMRRVLLKLEQCGHSPQRDQAARCMKAIVNFCADLG
ncbi:MAG: alpha/beta hydrolase [Brachymonas sp.]|nr:alpha/beta hydrolase [Brachymonas sp.]